MRSTGRKAFTSLGAILMLMLAGCAAPDQTVSPTEPPAAAVADADAMEATLAYLEGGLPDLSGKKLAFITSCATENAYCQQTWESAQQAASDLNAEVTLFNSAFDPATQQSQVQDAIVLGFDGYVFSPVADASGCAAFELLRQTGKPVANTNSPMCGNPDYTEGTVGFVGMQTEAFFQEAIEAAFASCQGECEAIAVGGFVGSDLFTRWQDAIVGANAKFPNVTVVSDQPGNFDPATALAVVQDALSANPDAELVLSSWDDMTRGAEEAIRAAGKTPGEDVRIYSVAGTQNGVDKVKAGAWNSTAILLPNEEAYYGFVQLARAIETGDSTPGFTSLAQAPAVVDGPGSLILTSENADTFTPKY